MDNEYIQKLQKYIKNKNAKIAIEEEMYSHILDKADYYIELGYLPDEAMKKATEDMGDAEDTAVPLNILHSPKWYKEILNWIVIVLLIVQALALIFFHIELQYHNETEYEHHFISTDFISLFVLCFNFVILHIGRKRKNKIILFSESISILLQLFFNPYQPLFYGIEKTLFSGYESYINSIFSYGVIPVESNERLLICSVALTGILLAYCVLSLLGIMSQERALTKKHFWRRFRIFEICAVFLICGNLIFMTVSTVNSYSDIETKKQELKALHNLQIETILNLEFNENRNFEDITKEFEYTYAQNGYDVFQLKDVSELIDDEDMYSEMYIENTCMSVYFLDSEDFVNYGHVVYSLNTGYDNTVTLIGDDIYCELSDFDFIRDGMSLEDFLETGLHKKAVCIVRNNNEDDQQLTFEFIVKDGTERHPVNINFFDNIYTMDAGVFSEYDNVLVKFLQSLE